MYLKFLVWFIRLISKYNKAFYGSDGPYLVWIHFASASDGHHNQTYLVQGTPWWRGRYLQSEAFSLHFGLADYLQYYILLPETHMFDRASFSGYIYFCAHTLLAFLITISSTFALMHTQFFAAFLSTRYLTTLMISQLALRQRPPFLNRLI